MSAINWRRPSQESCIKALVGKKEFLKKLYERTYSLRERQFHSSNFFLPIQTPNDSDWLANHEEPGQSFEEYWKYTVVVGSRSERKTSKATVGSTRTYSLDSLLPPSDTKIISILPLGNFPLTNNAGVPNAFLMWLQTYCASFFHNAKVQVLPEITVGDVKCSYRVNQHTGKFQLNAKNILTYLEQHKPMGCTSLVAVTMVDLFPQPSWNFVFGIASILHGVGVFSFARYQNSFYKTRGRDVVAVQSDGSLDFSPFVNLAWGGSREIDGLLLQRACKVMTHEICHMFGMQHCIYYECVMNGTNHLEESDKKPPFLCPICLRKLQFVLGFNLQERYKSLLAWSTISFWESYRHCDSKSGLSHLHLRASTPESISTGLSSPKRGEKAKSKPKNKSKTSLEIESESPGTSKDVQTSSLTSRSFQFISHSLHKSGITAPPLESFKEYKNWLYNVIKHLESDQ